MLNRVFNDARRRLGYPYWSLSQWLKRQVKEAVKGTDLAAIKTATAELDTASQAMAQHLYAQGGQPGAAPSGGPSAGGKKPGDDVIDAEYEVK